MEPHPIIEDHYHIRDLIEGQEKRTEERRRHQDIEKQRDEFSKTVAGFKNIETLDFWCSHCQVDFVGRARKQIDSWGEIAYYKIKHKCGLWSIRHITDRFRDAYFFRSKKIAIDRGQNFNNLIQPFENGFNLLYGKK